MRHDLATTKAKAAIDGVAIAVRCAKAAKVPYDVVPAGEAMAVIAADEALTAQ